MPHLILASAICTAIINFTPHHKRFSLSSWQKSKACKYSSVIEKEARANGIDPYTLTALIIVESGLRANVVSSKNACGLTQVIPKYTGGPWSGNKKYTCDQLKNPKTSIAVGSKILSWWIDYRGEDIRAALCSYNAGFRHCDKYRKTAAGFKYADKVLRLAESLRSASTQ